VCIRTHDTYGVYELHALFLAMELVTFHVRHSRGEMYIGHGRPYVCVSVRLPLTAYPDEPGCKLGEWYMVGGAL